MSVVVLAETTTAMELHGLLGDKLSNSCLCPPSLR
jgi:hypothetical protein